MRCKLEEVTVPEEEVSDWAGFALCRETVTSSSDSDDSWSANSAATQSNIDLSQFHVTLINNMSYLEWNVHHCNAFTLLQNVCSCCCCKKSELKLQIKMYF